MKVLYPTKYKHEQRDNPYPKIIPAWSMKKSFRDSVVQFHEIEPTSPHPINRRKPGVTLPVPGGIKPFKIMLREDCPDIQKEVVKSLREVDPNRVTGKKKRKGKKK